MTAVSAPASQSQAAAQQVSTAPVAPVAPVVPYASSSVKVPAGTASQAKATGTAAYSPAVSTFQGAAAKVGSGVVGVVVAMGVGVLAVL